MIVSTGIFIIGLLWAIGGYTMAEKCIKGVLKEWNEKPSILDMVALAFVVTFFAFLSIAAMFMGGSLMYAAVTGAVPS